MDWYGRQHDCYPYELRLSNRSRRTKTYVIEHVNHLIFWLTISIVLFSLMFQVKWHYCNWHYNFVVPTLPCSYHTKCALFFKDTRQSCCCRVPEGFPADPVYITSLFIALRVDQVIWGIGHMCFGAHGSYGW